ncbi:SPOR domain-containing protein [Vibrio viridaestus]|uniref:SPOR domain-containing protein n=1 Tax=Vibrio viridaestus TaxID=2487322 RepID=A0A3N9TM45_9VIBR|nr:SPOR domain-containing protein [Vibrio viridaestus]RQW65161.1 SPOR domain-containing protein [Vibrio viridaestus]
MKNTIIIGLSAILAACSSGTYVSDVTSESYKEDYQVDKVEQPIVTQNGMTDGITESHMSTAQQQPAAAAKPKPAVMIKAPTRDQIAKNPRYGFTIQVVAVGEQNKVDQFASRLPRDGQPIWENYKVVNGTKWYTIMYGDYATKEQAKSAINELPADFRNLKPFVKSIDSIKNSQYPTLNKLN